MIPRSNRTHGPLSALASVLLQLLVFGALLLPAHARAGEPPATGSEQASTHQTPLQTDWHTFVDEGAGFAIDLPPTHAVAATDYGIWYIHGFHEGEPMVPDVTIQLIRAEPGATLEEILGEEFSPSTLVEHVLLGGTVPGRRIVARYETMDGEPYVSSRYAVEVTEGAFVIYRYESFDWRWFDHVALSFRFVK
jgi:hypothetical protein